MNSKKFIQLATECGLSASLITVSKVSRLSFSLFHGEIDSYSKSTTSKILASGIYKGKLASASTEKDDASTAQFLIEQIKEGASLIEKKAKPEIYKGSKRYHKKNLYSKELAAWEDSKKLELLHELEDTLKGLDPRVSEVEVSYSEVDSDFSFTNSYGLNLKNKSNYYYFYGSVVVKDGDEVKSYGDIFLDSDPSKFHLKEFAQEIVQNAVSLLHGTGLKSKKYKAVLNQDVVSSLLNALLSNVSAEKVQKHSSLLEGKLGQQVLSKKISVDERPLEKNCFFSYFDDEGVATTNKKVFSRGKLVTYFYNLETAAKDGVESTGNAARAGGKMGISFNNIVLKPGKLSEEELFEKIKNGVYITSISGLHAGLNDTSGDFSLQAEGFHVKDGKKAGPLTLITIAGNLYDVFKDVIAVGNNSKLTLSSTNTPSIAVKNIAVNAE